MPKVPDSPFRAVAMTPTLPLALYGDAAALAISDLTTFGLQAPSADALAAARSGFAWLYRDVPGALGRAGADAFAALETLTTIDPNEAPADGAEYADNCAVGRSLRQIAQLIKADVGLTTAWTEYAPADWDTNTNHTGLFNWQAGRLATSLAAFHADLGSYADRVVVMTMTEFGRTVAENGSGGTDHGRASCCLLLGTAVAGGRVYGQVPSPDPDALEDRRDRPVTTDIRAVTAGVVMQHPGVTDAAALFPGWRGQPLHALRT